MKAGEGNQGKINAGEENQKKSKAVECLIQTQIEDYFELLYTPAARHERAACVTA